MASLGKDVTRAEELFRRMPDEDRLRFIAATFIALMQERKGQELNNEEKDYWVQNARSLVYWNGGKRNALELLQEAQNTVDSFLPKNQYYNFVSDLTETVVDFGHRVIGTVKEVTYEGASTVAAAASEGLKDQFQSLWDDYKSFVLFTMVLGLAGTILVAYLKKS